jgi:hypothetical protein
MKNLLKILLGIFIIPKCSLSQVHFQYGKYIRYDHLPIEISFGSNENQHFNYPDFGYRDDWNSYNTTDATLKLFIKYGKCNRKLAKPFVFVEGVSFEKKSIKEGEYSLNEYFNMYDGDSQISNNPILQDARNGVNPQDWAENATVGYSTFNWATLATGIDAEGVEDGEPLVVQKSPELLQKLYDANFDIIFVDFESGQQYMENNGFALSKALKAIKDSLDNNGSSEKIVVCGASMGGLVSRFAIRDLELNGGSNYNNCVGKFISFDSPQMGANINLGLQYTLQNLKSIGGSVGLPEKYAKLTCPSASQLVLYSCLEDQIGQLPIKYVDAKPSKERNQFNLHDNTATWPTNCKLYSIINGSRKGYAQNAGALNPCDLLFDGDGLASLDLRALPSNGNGYCKIFDFEFATPVCNIPLTSLGFTFNRSMHVRNSRSIDLVSGSYRTDLKSLESLNHPASLIIGSIWGGPCTVGNIISSSPTANAPNFCFIPAMSSAGIIDFANTVENSNTELPNLFNGSHKLVDPTHQKTYFDVVYAPEQNQTHVEITDENINWVMQILNGCDDEIIKFQNETVQSGTYTACDAIFAGNDVGKNVDCLTNPSECTSTIVFTYGFNGNFPEIPAIQDGESYLINNYGYDYNSDGTSYIYASWTIFSTIGKVKVQSSNMVTLQAGNIIDLQPGFEVESAAIFDAKILSNNENSCSGSGRFANPESSEPIASTSNIGYVKRNNATLFKRQSTTDDIDVILEKSDADKLVLIPNPATSTCNLFYNVENASEVIIEISTLYGQVLTRNNSSSQQNEGNHSVTLDVSKLTKGVYMVQIKTKDINRCTKLIVE